MTDEQLAEIRERLEKATPGPWVAKSISRRCVMNHAHGQGDCVYDVINFYDDDHEIYSADGETHIAGRFGYENGGVVHKPDQTFIAHAPTDIAALLAEVDALREWREKVKLLEFIQSLKHELAAAQIVGKHYEQMVNGHAPTECIHARQLRAIVHKREQVCDAMCPSKWNASEGRPHHIVCKLLTRIAARRSEGGAA